MEQNTSPTALEQQLAEAEERGYRRGLNEQIESKMRQPGVWESPDDIPPETPPDTFEILAHRPSSIWDS